MSTTGSINSLSSSHLQSILANAIQAAGLTTNTSNDSLSGIDTSSVSQGSDNGGLSPFAQLMSTLQQLQQSNPTQYTQVTQQIAANLQTAAQTAQSDGNATAVTQLSQLATDFTTASTSGQLPNIQDLAQAMGGQGVGGHHHHHHHSQAAATDSTGDPSASSSSSGSSSSASSAASSTSAAQMLTQLLSALEANATQSDALNPMSIITNTLSSAGVGTSNS